MLLPLALTVAVQGGVDLARIQTDDNLDSAYVGRPVFGASVAFDLEPPIALRLELDYLEKGGKITTGGPSGPTADYTLSYLALPVNLRWDLGTGTTLAYVFAGTTVAALLAASRGETDIKSHLHGVEIAIDLGFGIGYRLTPAIAVTFDVRYAIGLNQVAADRVALEASAWTSRSIQMVGGVAYSFNP